MQSLYILKLFVKTFEFRFGTDGFVFSAPKLPKEDRFPTFTYKCRLQVVFLNLEPVYDAKIEKLKSLSKNNKVCVEVSDHCIMNVDQSTSTVSLHDKRENTRKVSVDENKIDVL